MCVCIRMYFVQSDYFHSLSKESTVLKLEVYDQVDSEGQKAIAVVVHCIVHGNEKVCLM